MTFLKLKDVEEVRLNAEFEIWESVSFLSFTQDEGIISNADKKIRTKGCESEVSLRNITKEYFTKTCEFKESKVIQEKETSENQNAFMEMFGLVDVAMISKNRIKPLQKSKQNREMLPLSEKEDKMQTKVPFSSFAGRILTRQSLASPAYVTQKLQEIEENCSTKGIPILKNQRHSRRKCDKPLFKRMKNARFYTWPQRHLRSASRKGNFNFINCSLIQMMKPCCVEMNRISEKTIEAHKSLRKLQICVSALSTEKVKNILQNKNASK